MMRMLDMIGKEPSLTFLWGASVLLGLIGFFATRFRRWLVLPALLLVVIVAWLALGDLLDPRLGPAILQEAGQWYVLQAGAAVAFAVILCVIGLTPKREI